MTTEETTEMIHPYEHEAVYTAIPHQRLNAIDSAIEPPSVPLPWSAEMNDLYVQMTGNAWVELISPRDPEAAAALAWFEGGALVGHITWERAADVSLYEVWNWPSERVRTAARARYENRAALRRQRDARQKRKGRAGGAPTSTCPAGGTPLASEHPRD